MTVGYGEIYVSGDYKGDLESILRVMNQWDWGGGSNQFKVIKSSIVPTQWVGEYPTALPLCYVQHDGTPIPYNEIDDEVKIECDQDEIELETISRAISPLLKSGTLRVAAENHERENTLMTTLQISSDGRVEGMAVYFGPYTAEFIEDRKSVYDPKDKGDLSANKSDLSALM
jgi:hypothetical protein